MVKSVGAESEAATVWPRSMLRWTTTPSTGDLMSVRERSISASRSFACFCRIAASADRVCASASAMSASSPTSSAFCEAICASTESSVAFWTSVAVFAVSNPACEAMLRAMSSVWRSRVRFASASCAATRSRWAAEVAQRRLGAHAGRADAVDAGLAHAEIGARLLDVGVGGVAPGPDLGRVEPGDDLPFLHLAVVVGEDLDHLPRQLRPDEHGRDRVQRAGRAHARRDRRRGRPRQAGRARRRRCRRAGSRRTSPLRRQGALRRRSRKANAARNPRCGECRSSIFADFRRAGELTLRHARRRPGGPR